MEIIYCDKCGNITVAPSSECFVCKNAPLLLVPSQYLHDFRYNGFEWYGSGYDAFLQEVLLKSPNLDEELYKNKDIIAKKKSAILNVAYKHGKAIQEGRDKGNSYGVSCPYCGATNVKKILATSRIASVGFFGLGSRKIGKQWHCTKCGSDF